MNVEITCFTCFESLSEYIDFYDGLYQEIIDCEVCCRPNKVSLEIKNESIIRINISDGNEEKYFQLTVLGSNLLSIS